MILAADIGGTKTVLALYQAGENKLECVTKVTYSSKSFDTFYRLLDDFLSEQHPTSLRAACIGVAGPVINGSCVTTNLPWSLNNAEIIKILGTQQVQLLNDLEAAAWGVLELSENEVVDLNPDAEFNRLGNIAIIAAGTGLGEAILCWNGSQYYAMATEGGHTDFAPNGGQEIALLEFMRKKHPRHVSYERLVSGEGLPNIYQFLKDSGVAVESKEIAQQMSINDPAAVIGNAGVAKTDTLCVKTLQLFSRIYGAEAGNLALNCLPYGGIYLAGGIGAKILPSLQAGQFMQSFLNKGRYQAMLKKMPVRVSLNPDVGLIGAANFAVRLAN
jgi:glucokinase